MKTELDYIRDAKFRHTDSVIHAFTGGSALHGAKLEGKDDHDIYGVFVEPPELVLGIDREEHFCWSTSNEKERNTAEDVDITLYGLRNWAGLAAKGNPTCLQFLFAVSSQPDLIWERVARARHLFIAKSCAKQFLGYADAQLRRMKGERGSGKHGQRDELVAAIGYDSKAAMHMLRVLYECSELMRTAEITFPSPRRDTLIEVRKGAWSMDRVIREANHLFEVARADMERSKLPESINRQLISGYVAMIYRDFWKLPKAEAA